MRSGIIWTTSVAHAGNNMTLSLLTGVFLSGTLGATALTAVMGRCRAADRAGTPTQTRIAAHSEH